jgi:hypothetical protein
MKVGIGYLVHPGSCFSCRNPQSDALTVDLEQDDPGTVKRHHVYLCAGCVQSAAKMLSDAGAPFEVVDRQALDEMRDALADADEAVQRLEALNAQVEGLRDLARQIAGDAG